MAIVIFSWTNLHIEYTGRGTSLGVDHGVDCIPSGPDTERANRSNTNNRFWKISFSRLFLNRNNTANYDNLLFSYGSSMFCPQYVQFKKVHVLEQEYICFKKNKNV